ncbi:MAG: hypothetical protein JMN25_17325 [gamma proteobacterium endosymbiont of Lamellibrachia anaximandri]|nr:hypothetical protein [gamma proteobacterium endosymbiont of Lamellibrachia anaximandri]
MDMYSDNYIEFYAEVYLANRAVLRDRGILFETFLHHPEEILEAAAFKKPLPLDDTFYPLLPAQAAVQERLFNQEFDAWLMEGQMKQLSVVLPTGPSPVRVSDGRIIEPLHHSARMARRGTRCWFRPGARA